MKSCYNLFRLTLLSSGKWILMVFVTHLLVGGLFHVKYFRWHVYMMYGYILIAFLSSFYFNKEFKIENKYVLYSLPVKKETIVYFRYLFSFIMFFICLGLWFFNGYFFDVVWDEHLTSFDEIYHSKVLFIALLFYIIQQSLFIPTSFVFKMTGIIISFVLALSIAVASVPLIFYPYSYRYSYYFHQQDTGLIIFLSILMLILITSSIFVSRIISHKYDL